MSTRKITVRSGKERIWMEVTEEEYQSYYRPWWQQKKREQRNREAMEEKGYSEESYEAWRDGRADDRGIPDGEILDMDEIVEKQILLGVLEEALQELLPEEKELALHVWGGEMTLREFAERKGKNPRTMSDNKKRVMDKLRKFFEDRGFEVYGRYKK